VIVTTSEDLGTLVGRGLFRADLYDMLNVATLSVPPLRERRDDDILAIAGHILSHYGLADGIAPAAAALLGGHDYARDNIRELEEILRTAALQCGGGVIQPEHLPETVAGKNTLGNTNVDSSVPDEKAVQIAELSELVATKRRRLHRLRVQASTHGNLTPPAITIEIEQIERDIVKLEANIRALNP